MRVVFTRLARLELQDAAAFYELEVPGLGSQFREDVRSSISRIAQYPTAWPIERGQVRKCLLHRFPYKLLYSLEKDHILIPNRRITGLARDKSRRGLGVSRVFSRKGNTHQGGARGGMGILPMMHGRDARATVHIHSLIRRFGF